MISRQTPRLLVGACGRVGVAGHDRRGARDPDVVADAHGARVADAILERGAGRDAKASHLHSVRALEAFRQVESWDCEHVAVGVTGRIEATYGDAGAPFRLGVGDEARHRGRDARRRRGGAGRPRRARRPARVDAPASARARLGPAVRGRALRSRDRASGASTRTPPSTLRRIWSPSAPSCRSPTTSQRCGRHRDRARRPGRLGHDGHARRRARAGARAAGCRPGSRPRRWRRRRRCSSRASTACCPGSAGRSRTTGASASSFATARARTGPATRNSPRTFGHFGRSGTFLWVDPEAGIALACLTDRPFGDWAATAWPRLADAVLAELA